jgi:ATP-dependent DNA helicase RecQ
VDFTGGDRPLIVLTEPGRAVMKAERAARLMLPSDAAPARRRSKPGAKPAVAHDDAPPTAPAVFEALRAHRLSLARAASVPPYVIASDRTLRDLAATQPRTMEALLAVHGIGPAKAERYGDGFLAVIARAVGAA